jgi:hypothetical protein
MDEGEYHVSDDVELVFHNQRILCRDYNFQAILSASSLIYGFIGFVPLAVWFCFKQYDPKLRFPSVLCVYGYGGVVFLPALVLASKTGLNFISP